MISILVPYAPAGPERELSWRWNQRRWRYLFPHAELVVEAPDRVGDPGLFCRAQALNRAAKRARGDVFILSDSDTTMTISDLAQAVMVALDGGWALPHRYVRLNQDASTDWISRGYRTAPPVDWEERLDQEYPFPNSGVVAISRATFEAAHGFDERFRGWGGEDDAFTAAAATLAGSPTRAGVAFHLWHPRPVEHSTGQPYYLEQCGLSDRYGRASGDRAAIAQLIGER